MGKKAEKPKTAARSAEAHMMTITTRRRPKRPAASLPSTLAGRPSMMTKAARVAMFQSAPVAPSGCRLWA